MKDPNTGLFLQINLAGGESTLEWETPEELRTWISELTSQWSWLGDIRNTPTTNAWNTLYHQLTQCSQLLISAINNKNNNENQSPHEITALKAQLTAVVTNYPWLLATTPKNQFIENLRNTNQPIEAGLIVAYWMAMDFSGAPMPQAINAIVAWELFDRKIDGRIKPEKDALERLTQDFTESLTKLRQEEREQREQLQKARLEFELQQNVSEEWLSREKTKTKEEWDQLLATTQAEFTNLKDAYDKHMSLAAPVDYWERKRRKHRNLSGVSLTVLILVGLAIGYHLNSEINTIANLAAIAQVTPTTPTGNTNKLQLTLGMTQSAATWHFGAFILSATLSFWLLRLIVRLFLSNLHLENDASERVTMVKTYLALLRDGGIPKDSGIGTILAALFRPTGDGIVKDEGLPPTAMEWMTKLGNK